MTLLKKVAHLLPWRRRRAEREQEAEMASIAELAAEDAVESGLAPEEAKYAARRALGNLTLAGENARAVWTWMWLESTAADLRYAFRVLRNQPGFTAVALLSLALGIGANAAIFTLVDAVLLRDLPVRDPGRLVAVDRGYSRSYFYYERLAAASSEVFTGILATAGVEPREVDAGAGPQRSHLELVTGSYFGTLGVPALRGRLLTPDDDRSGAPEPVAVISHGFWQRRFGGDVSAVGKTIRIEKLPFTIVGIAPPEFFGVNVGQAADVWAPVWWFGQIHPGRDYLKQPRANFLSMIARLKPGVTAQQAESALTPAHVAIQLERAPNASEWSRKSILKQRLRLGSASNGLSWLRARFSNPLRVVFVMVGVALLIACVNIASLQLAHARERRRELGIRLAIGAGRARVMRQLFSESCVLAGLGGLLGILLCRPLAHALVLLVFAGDDSAFVDTAISGAILTFTAAVSVAAVLIFGLLPAWEATRGDLIPSLQDSGRATQSCSRRILGRGLASVQIALGTVLVAAAFLFSGSFYQLTHFDVGFDRRRLAMIDLDAIEAGYEEAQVPGLCRLLLERVAAVPGVHAASFSNIGLHTGSSANIDVQPEGYQAADPRDRSVWVDQVGPRFFSTVGTALIAGRDFSERDDASAPKVAIVNEQFARFYFPGRSPLGRHIEINGRDTAEVVGIARDVRIADVRREAERYLYVPRYQMEGLFMTIRLLVRTGEDPSMVFPAIRQAIREEVPALRITSMKTLDAQLGQMLDRERLMAALSVAFAILALALAAVGIYGLLSYEVTRRTGEVGIRMALGAKRTDVVRMILGDVAVIAAFGLAGGSAAALASAKYVESLVFGLRPQSPALLASAVLILLMVALGAAARPAARAAAMDPMVALRHE